VILMPLDEGRGLSNTSKITLTETGAGIPVGDFLLGRVIDGKGNPIDDKGPLGRDTQYGFGRVNLAKAAT